MSELGVGPGQGMGVGPGEVAGTAGPAPPPPVPSIPVTYPASIIAYTGLIVPEHANKPKFVATVGATVQPFADMVAMLLSLPEDFDVDNAIGAQLDAVGLWVGVSRYLKAPLPNVYFTLGDPDLGLGSGVLFMAGDLRIGVDVLPDAQFRTLILATIIANNWDGSIPGAYAAWDFLFANTGTGVLIQDYGNDTMGMALIGARPDAITLAMFQDGILDIKPAGVTMIHIMPGSWPAGQWPAGNAGTPYFCTGAQGVNVAGLGSGQLAFAEELGPRP